MDLGIKFEKFDEMVFKSDFISLHTPLLLSTKNILDKNAFDKIKYGVVIVNATMSRLINTTDLLQDLKLCKVGYAGLDVLERELGALFNDLSDRASEIKSIDKKWYQLPAMNNVLVTSHQAFFTKISQTQIAKITLSNADDAEKKWYIKGP